MSVALSGRDPEDRHLFDLRRFRLDVPPRLEGREAVIAVCPECAALVPRALVDEHLAALHA